MQRPRTRSKDPVAQSAPGRHPIGTPSGLSPNTGPLACAAWLVERGITCADNRWFVIAAFDAAPDAQLESFDEDSATRFQVELFSEEWGFRFCHRGRVSWVRITDIAFAHGRDDHDLLASKPRLKDIGKMLRALEKRYDLSFDRTRPLTRTSISGAEDAVREWARSI